MSTASPLSIAASLRAENVCEYVLFLWQQEDLLRAFGMDVDKLSQAMSADEETRQWYEHLAVMMSEEGVAEQGHPQVHQNVIVWLSELHTRLLASPKFPFYSAAYYKALPFIVELRSRSHGEQKHEIENCLEAMYGLLMLRLKGKQASAETQTAIDAISKLLSMLAAYYKQDQAGTLEE